MNSRVLLPFHVAALAVFTGMRMLADAASSESLRFLLRPVNALVQLLTGAPSVWQPGQGYYFPSLHIIIDKTCSGMSFWSLAFGVLHLCLSQGKVYQTHHWKAFALAVAGAFLCVIPVNAFRIYLSLFTENTAARVLPQVSAAGIHQATGIAVQLVFLVLLYLLAHRFLLPHSETDTPVNHYAKSL